MGVEPEEAEPDLAARMEAARLAIGRLVEQGLLDANAATRQLLALDLEARHRQQGAAPPPDDAPGPRSESRAPSRGAAPSGLRPDP